MRSRWEINYREGFLFYTVTTLTLVRYFQPCRPVVSQNSLNIMLTILLVSSLSPWHASQRTRGRGRLYTRHTTGACRESLINFIKWGGLIGHLCLKKDIKAAQSTILTKGKRPINNTDNHSYCNKRKTERTQNSDLKFKVLPGPVAVLSDLRLFPSLCLVLRCWRCLPWWARDCFASLHGWG